MLNRVTNLIFEKYHWGSNGIILTYLIDDHKVSYKIKITTHHPGEDLVNNYPINLRHNITPYIINTGIGLLSFMIKRYYPINIIINAVQLDKTSLNLWTGWFTKGLGEFFYRHKLPHKLNVMTCHDKPILKAHNFKLKSHALLPNGGGKDSIVSSELLDTLGIDYTWVTVGLTSYRKKVINSSSHNNYINISHIQYGHLPRNFKTYNGHFPYTLYTSSLICLVSGLNHCKYVVYSNEKSANYPNLTITENGHKISINHQFTKSFQFEQEYAYFLKHYVNSELDYFSILRPLYEIQIAKIFSHFQNYHNVFVSCNRGRWCGSCSKCAFIYLALYPYLPTKQINQIIGNNMLDNPNQLSTYLELTGHKDFKPFECVGTIEENRIVMEKAIKKAKQEGQIPYVIKYYLKNIKKRPGRDNISLSYNEENMIPKPLKQRVKTCILGFLQKSNSTKNPYPRKIKNLENKTSYIETYLNSNQEDLPKIMDTNIIGEIKKRNLKLFAILVLTIIIVILIKLI